MIKLTLLLICSPYLYFGGLHVRELINPRASRGIILFFKPKTDLEMWIGAACCLGFVLLLFVI